MKGIDISVYQMGADWKKVKNSGIEFAMIKASQGGGIRDKGIAPLKTEALPEALPARHPSV